MLYIAPSFVEGKKVESNQIVSFEVVVTTSKDAGGGIKVFSLGEAKGGISSEAVNKIAFDVPVYFQAPTLHNERHYSNTEDGCGDPGVDL